MKYDFEKAKQIIEQEKLEGAVEAALMTSIDRYYTTDIVWSKNSGYVDEIFTEREVVGIDGSNWDTPIIKITYGDGKTKELDCYKEE